MPTDKLHLEAFKEYLEKNVLTHIYPGPTAEILKSKCQKPRKPREPRPQNEIKTTFNGKPFHGNYENVISSSDGRKQVNTTDQWPNSVHGVIEGKFNDETFKGTGIMIGPNIVLTTGHNLFHYARRVFADLESMRFKPGINGKSLPFGEIKVEKYFVPDDYVNEEKEDYGILILEEPIGEVTGYFGLACLESTKLFEKKVIITGYPEDKVKSKPGISEMWKMRGQVEEIDEEQGLISYKIDTGKGQSGSGVYYGENGEYFVCGVHAQGGQTVNMATLLTKHRYAQIYRWIQNNVKTEFLFLLNTEYLRVEKQKVDTKFTSLLLEYDLSDLRVLSCQLSSFEKRGAQILAQKMSWIHLSELYLIDNQIGVEGAKQLAQNTSWINLSLLCLSSNNLSDEGAKVLAQNTSWINLSRLNLSENKIGDEGAKALARNTSWSNLYQLYLSRNDIGDEGAQGLAQNTSWTNLSQLYLSHNNISNRGAKGLAQNTAWKNLSELFLCENKIGNKGAKGLAQNKSWVNLLRLYISRNKISGKGAKELAHNKSWINLSKLDLSRNNIGDEGAQGLAQNKSWINLSHLYLSHNNIGNEGARGLGKNTSWKHLSVLNLQWNSISDKGGKGLVQKKSSWKKLVILRLEGNQLSHQGAKAIAQSKIKIEYLFVAWNYMSYEGTQILSKYPSISKDVELSFYFYNVDGKRSRITISQIESIWNTLKAHDRLRIPFTSRYRSLVMKTLSQKGFEDFLIDTAHFMHSRFDVNFPLANTENDDKLFEESDSGHNGSEINSFRTAYGPFLDQKSLNTVFRRNLIKEKKKYC